MRIGPARWHESIARHQALAVGRRHLREVEGHGLVLPTRAVLTMMPLDRLQTGSIHFYSSTPFPVFFVDLLPDGQIYLVHCTADDDFKSLDAGRVILLDNLLQLAVVLFPA